MKTPSYIGALAATVVLLALGSAPGARAQVDGQVDGQVDREADVQANVQGDVERGRQLGYTCLGCHGIEGYRNAYPSYRVPRLDGQKAAYLETALAAYRAGTRPHPTMQAQAGSLDDQAIADLVAWITAGETATDDLDAQTPGLPEAARTCVTCHGTAGREVMPAPPVLSGQHPGYLRHALEQYEAGARGQNVMNAFAAGLSPADMALIAQYYGSLEGLTTLQERE